MTATHCLAALVFFAIASASIAQPLFVAADRSEYRCKAVPEMRMPTDVAVGPDGSVFVADGVNDRVLVFRGDGELSGEIHSLDDQTLSKPLGVAVDAAGRLWIADTGHHRAVARSPDGRLERVVVAPSGSGERPADITDVAVSHDGKTLWMVDNDNHRLISVDLGTDTQTIVGRQGESLGQFNHPFLIALGRDDAVYVGDTVNARVLAFSAVGAPSGSIGTYGVELGQLYRPKGIACDRDGNVWVADSTLGVVQIFAANGTLIDVIRDASGRPFHMQMPVGIALDAEGDLYVAELGADRVRRLSIKHGPSRPANKAQVKPQGQIVGAQGRSCTVCHIEWIEPLSAGVGTALFDVPPNTPEQPAVSRSETCLSCHDGSVVDSRRRVWQEHGHRTGVVPPPSITVPSNLPLVDGKIACRTCHSAHTSGQFDPNISTAVFLRVRNDSSELCISCHADKTRGPKLGTHPTGGMPWPVPKNLIDAGARIGPNPRELTCQVCHTPHGAAHDHLLVLGTESNQLCISCHEKMRPGMFRTDQRAEHPRSPVVNAEQAAAVHDLGTKLGPDNRLICLSCHKLHHGKGERFMLAEDLTDGRFCTRCHSDKTSVFGTSHDLRQKFPDERNRLGMTAQSGGPCSACHLFHRYARPPESSTVDPAGGKCVTCHQEGRCAGSKSLGPVNHNGSACTGCHNPHQTRFAHFLRGPVTETCVRCHLGYDGLADGPHDIKLASTGRPGDSPVATWPAASRREDNDRCMACHRPHGDKSTGLFRAAAPAGVSGPDAGCVTCHPKNAWNSGTDRQMQHPSVVPATYSTGSLPLVRCDEPQNFAVGCRTCHNPHVPDGKATRFMRTLEGEPASTVCLNCHHDNKHIDLTGHAPAKLVAAHFDASACRPCHSVHAGTSTVDGTLLWSRSLAAQRAGSVADRYCVACHAPGGAAKPPATVWHPDVQLMNVSKPGEPGFLPLFNEEGRIDAHGRISCRTCHTPHGQSPGETTVATAQFSTDEYRAMRLLLRPFNPPNLCTTCHGTDGLSRFLYFHDPSRRSGPLNR